MIQTEKISVRDIPVYRVRDSEADNGCPVVIALHGLGENKESLLPYAELFAKKGVAVLIPDAPRHGERSSGKDQFSLSSLHRVLPVLVGFFNDVDTLLDYVRTAAGPNPVRIGITGVSMGGAVTLAAMAKHQEIKTGVALLTMDSAKSFARHHKFPKMMWPAVSYLDTLLDRKRIPPRSLLMLNGTADPIIPVDSVREFVQDMKSMYDGGGKIEMIEYPGVGHEVVPDMVDRTSEWFAKYL